MTATARRVPVRYFALLRDALHAQGVDTAALLRMARLGATRLDDRDASLLPTEVENLLAAASRLTGRTDLGFEMGQRIKMTSHDVLGFGMLGCSNLDQVLRLVARHYHLMTETVTFRYRRGRTHGEVLYTPTIPMPIETLHFYCEMLAGAHQNQVRLMLGPASYDIHLAMPAPPHVRRYDALAPVRFHFDERALPGVRVVTDAELLDRPLPLANPRLVEQIDERCTALGQRPGAEDTDWVEVVRMVLRESHGEQVTLQGLAERFKVSARTIDRHLKKQQVQFRDLAQEMRFERACAMLKEPGATVAHVALNLGFSDAANFSRAFRRVVGVAPSEYQTRKAASSS